MLIRTVSTEEYSHAFPTPRNIYGSEAFIGTVSGRCKAVRRFIGYDDNGKPRMGLVAGYTGHGWEAPFSAPFAEVAYAEPRDPECIYDFISELTAFLGEQLEITLPPAFYDPGMLPKITGVFGNFAEKTWLDFNYYYPLDRINGYVAALDRAARKNFNRALQTGYEFAPCSLERAYPVISANRQSHGYSLAMTLQQLQDTAKAVEIDSFILSLPDTAETPATDVAAAICYHVAPGIVQVIYWGDAPGHTQLRPMNLLPYRLFTHYAAMGMKIVDVGPSSTRGIPNTGLCRFKESVGCIAALKPTFLFG